MMKRSCRNCKFAIVHCDECGERFCGFSMENPLFLEYPDIDWYVNCGNDKDGCPENCPAERKREIEREILFPIFHIGRKRADEFWAKCEEIVIGYPISFEYVISVIKSFGVFKHMRNVSPIEILDIIKRGSES